MHMYKLHFDFLCTLYVTSDRTPAIDRRLIAIAFEGVSNSHFHPSFRSNDRNTLISNRSFIKEIYVVS